MSNLVNDTELKDYLLSHDPNFRELAETHRRYEARLSELAAVPHPSADERLEESVLKKKKLSLKDRMAEIALKYKVGHRPLKQSRA